MAKEYVTLLFSVDEHTSAQTINQQGSLLQSSLLMIWILPHLSFHPHLTLHLIVKVHQNISYPVIRVLDTSGCPPASCHATSMHHSPVICQLGSTAILVTDTQNATPTPLLPANGHIVSCRCDTGRDIDQLGWNNLLDLTLHTYK